jgi:D-serine deaminase-like pyridoxal phosphate-dependent protein
MVRNINEIETPALLLDKMKLNRNIERMMKVRDTYGVQVRPHFKTHKSVMIAKRQLEAGACGITVATVSEAEVLLENGVDDILLAFPVADPKRIGRMLDWTKKARIILTIDSIEQGSIVEEEAAKRSVSAEVWIKINSGLNRCGTEPGQEAAELAEFLVKKCAHLQLTGMFTHAGHSYKASGPEELDAIAEEEAESVLKSAELCSEAGIKLKHLSVGSTPTFERAAKYKGITEVRPGNAVFFDAMQAAIGVASWEETALTIVASVVSKKGDRLILDAGSKALTTEKGAHGNEAVKGFGRVITENGELYVSRVSEEHGIIDYEDNSESFEGISGSLALNDKVEIVPNHACVSVNLFNHYNLLLQDGRIEVLAVDARGKSQ